MKSISLLFFAGFLTAGLLCAQEGPRVSFNVGGGFTPLLGFAERGLECEPGLVDGRRRARTGRALGRRQPFLLRPERRGLLFSTRRRLRQGAFEAPLLRDVPEGAQRRRTRVLDAPQRDRVDLQGVAQSAEPDQVDLRRPPFARDDPREKGSALPPVLGSDQGEH